MRVVWQKFTTESNEMATERRVSRRTGIAIDRGTLTCSAAPGRGEVRPIAGRGRRAVALAVERIGLITQNGVLIA